MKHLKWLLVVVLLTSVLIGCAPAPTPTAAPVEPTTRQYPQHYLPQKFLQPLCRQPKSPIHPQSLSWRPQPVPGIQVYWMYCCQCSKPKAA